MPQTVVDKDIQFDRFLLRLLVKLQSIYHHWALDSVYLSSSKDMTNYLESKHRRWRSSVTAIPFNQSWWADFALKVTAGSYLLSH